MKRLVVCFFLSMAGWSQGSAADGSSAQQPVWVYLYARITDHVNADLSEERLRRVLPMIERYRNEHPEAHVAATVLFTGAVSEALAERNSKTHIADYVKDYAQRGIIEPGYDGADEPTYKNRPMMTYPLPNGAADRWLLRESTAEKMLGEARDPVTGAARPGEEGGLKKMQAVFGQASCIAGATLSVKDPTLVLMPEVGSDSEIVHFLRRIDDRAIMFGFSDGDAMHFSLYREWVAAFSKAMSPLPETSPELFWRDHVLRTSETSEADLRLFRASDGAEALQKVLGKLDRSHVRILHVEIGAQRNSLTAAYANALDYAYGHPESPMLPADFRRPAADVDAAYAREDGVLRSLTKDFFPANAGSRFVSSGALRDMAEPSSGFRVTSGGLRASLTEVLRGWGNAPEPPKYVRVDGRYLSLADLFQTMTDELAGLDEKGQLPKSVQVVPVFGPEETTADSGKASGEVTVAEVAHACADLRARLHDDRWAPLPKNSIPFMVKVGAIEVNAAQFLRLMAEALTGPLTGTKLAVKRTAMFWGRDETSYRSRSLRDLGAAWTYKPAVLRLAAKP